MTSPLSYHGIVIAQGFRDPTFPQLFPIFAKRISQSDGWTIYGIEINAADLENTIGRIQEQFVSVEPWYAHLYNDEELIVIFKNRVFRATPQRSTWDDIIAHGTTLGIPASQLDFWPNRYQDEIHYFAPEVFSYSKNTP